MRDEPSRTLSASAPSAGSEAARERGIDLKGGSLRGHAARGTVINAAFLVGLSTLGLLKGFVVAGLLTRADYGIWGIVSVSLATILSLKQVGVGDRFIQQSEGDQERAFHKAFSVELVFTSVFALFLLAAVPLLALVYRRTDIIAPGLILALTLPAGILQAPLWVFYRRMQFLRQRTLQAIDPVVGFIVTVALAAAGFGYWSFVLGIVAGVWSSAIAAVIVTPYPIRLVREPGMLREYWAFSWPLLITALATLVIAQGTLIATEASIGVAAIGAISLAQTVAHFSDRVDGVVSGAMYPAICAVRDRTDLLAESFVKSNRLALMWALPFGIGLALFAADLVAFVIGEKWEPALGLLQAFGLTAAFGHIGFNWHAYFRARGDTRPIAVVQVIVLISFVVAVLPLLLVYELDGLALGVGVMTLTAIIARSIFLARLFPGFALARHAARAIAPSVLPVLVVLGARFVGPDERTPAVAALELGAYLAATAACTLVLERSLLRELLGYLRRPRAVTA